MRGAMAIQRNRLATTNLSVWFVVCLARGSFRAAYDRRTHPWALQRAWPALIVDVRHGRDHPPASGGSVLLLASAP